MQRDHVRFSTPSPWVVRFGRIIPPRGEVLDYACGTGRHARWLASHGYRVEAVDKDAVALELLTGVHHVRTRQADLEADSWPYEGRLFDGIVVTNYLYRPRLSRLLECLVPGGVLIYETFMAGHERFGKPTDPDFLLRPHELLKCVSPGFSVVAFEQGEVGGTKPAMLQRICAVKAPATNLILP